MRDSSANTHRPYSHPDAKYHTDIDMPSHQRANGKPLPPLLPLSSRFKHGVKFNILPVTLRPPQKKKKNLDSPPNHPNFMITLCECVQVLV